MPERKVDNGRSCPLVRRPSPITRFDPHSMIGALPMRAMPLLTTRRAHSRCAFSRTRAFSECTPARASRRFTCRRTCMAVHPRHLVARRCPSLKTFLLHARWDRSQLAEHFRRALWRAGMGVHLGCVAQPRAVVWRMVCRARPPLSRGYLLIHPTNHPDRPGCPSTAPQVLRAIGSCG